jgi:hypothetical protein
VTCSSQINGSPVDLAHGGTISVISDIAVNRHGHVEGYTQDFYNLPEQYVHPEADVTSTSTNVTLDHGDTFVVKNDTFDELGHITTETTTTYTLPAQYVHPDAENSESSNATTLEYGDSFDVVTESFDAQGHRIGTHTETYTLPELPTPTEIGAVDESTLEFVVSESEGNPTLSVVCGIDGASAHGDIVAFEHENAIDITLATRGGGEVQSHAIVFDVKDKGITTAKIADHAVGAAQIKAEKGYTGDDAEVWVFDCGGAE